MLVTLQLKVYVRYSYRAQNCYVVAGTCYFEPFIIAFERKGLREAE